MATDRHDPRAPAFRQLDAMRRRSRPGLWVLVAGALLWPLAVMAHLDARGDPGAATLVANAAGFLAFTGAVVQVLLIASRGAGRIHPGPLVRLHRVAGLALLGLVVFHVVVLVADDPRRLGRLDVVHAPAAGRAGVAALVAMLGLAATSLLRRRLRLGYDVWRLAHVVLTAVLLGGAYAHVLLVARHAAHPAVRWALAAFLVGGAIAIYVQRVLRPFGTAARRRMQVTASVSERGGCTTLVLAPDTPDGVPPRFSPGQFVWVKLARRPYALAEHPFSIASSARAQDTVELTIRPSGETTRALAASPPGTALLLDGPWGGWHPPVGEGARYCLVAAGTGITPVMSILRTMADDGDRRPVHLLYGSASWDEVIFRDELAELVATLDLGVAHVIADGSGGDVRAHDVPARWEVRPGRIDHDVIDEVARMAPTDDAWFACGPSGLLDTVEHALADIGVPRQLVHIERYRLA